MAPHERITYNPKILYGKPIISGTRISVEQILALLAKGVQSKEICEEFPDLKIEDVLAAVAYAQATIAAEEVRHADRVLSAV